MSNLSKLQSLSSVLSKGIAKEIQSHIEKTPGAWTHRSNNEGFLSHGGQCYAGVTDNTVAKIGTSGNPIVGK
ncbi:hypothetical protein CMI47_11590 [Candidatus Pacearchaeota archaeon]|jgi:hypothetical protein|nr:hypothetical protein [Candidatus Pacearchaeota archaeon]|tara:strand:+ start:7342 stop:7557 length:216 start_codon:yes stop_codon:yes gene_type:complete